MYRCTLLLAVWISFTPLSLKAQEEAEQEDPLDNVLLDRVDSAAGRDEEVLPGPKPGDVLQRSRLALIADADEEPLHEELRELRDGLVAAVNKGDLDGIAAYCHENIRFTAPDATISRGPEGVRKYYLDKTQGPDAVVASFKSNPVVDDLTLLYGGDTGVATGTSTDHFKLTNGMEFDLHTRWSATLVRENGRWLIANYHTATDVFDNPLLNSAKRMLYLASAIALVLGLVLGMVLMLLVIKFRPRKAAA
jgi:ketosteroid isomerase-like protein